MLMLIINALLIPFAIIMIGYGVRLLAMRHVPRKLLIFWTYPGVAIHELSHAGACIPALAKVQKITLFTASGEGEVQHTQPRLKYVGPVMISMAPLVGGIAALVVLNWLLGYPFRIGEVSGDAARSSKLLYALILTTVERAPSALWNANWLDVRTWAMLYLGVSISLTMMPSKQDMKNCALGMVVVIALTLVIWLLLEQVLGLSEGAGLSRAVTWVLGFSRVALFFYLIDLLLILILWGIGKMLAGQKQTKR